FDASCGRSRLRGSEPVQTGEYSRFYSKCYKNDGACMNPSPVSTTYDMSLLALISNASLPVQIVMVILLLASLVSWWYIFIKIFTIQRADKDAADFERAFWTGGDLNQLYEGISSGRRHVRGMASIFEAGFNEFARLKRQGGLETSDIMESARRAMRAAYNREMD